MLNKFGEMRDETQQMRFDLIGGVYSQHLLYFSGLSSRSFKRKPLGMFIILYDQINLQQMFTYLKLGGRLSMPIVLNPGTSPLPS